MPRRKVLNRLCAGKFLPLLVIRTVTVLTVVFWWVVLLRSRLLRTVSAKLMVKLLLVLIALMMRLMRQSGMWHLRLLVAWTQALRSLFTPTMMARMLCRKQQLVTLSLPLTFARTWFLPRLGTMTLVHRVVLPTIWVTTLRDP